MQFYKKFLRLILVLSIGIFVLSGCDDGDITPPVIKLNGKKVITIFKGSKFKDPGATATDNKDGNITSRIIVIGNVDTSKIGVYTLIYKVSDKAGNKAKTTREVKVIAKKVIDNISHKDTTPPTFTSSPTATVPENQTDAITLKATDTSTPIVYSISGGDSSSFTVDSSSGKVTFKTAPDYETKNKYTFTAKATDAKGNTATQSVVINISDVKEIASNNFKIILTSKKNISAFEYIIEIKNSLLRFPNIETNSSFLTKNGRKNKNLKHIISRYKVRFGAYSTGSNDGVAGKHNIGKFTTELNISKIRLYNVQCVDKLANIVDCNIEIYKDEEN